MTNLRTAKYMANGTAIDDPNETSSLGDAGITALTSAQSGEPLTITIDGSNRMATMTNQTTGRVATITYADATHGTISDNRTPQAVGTFVLDGSGRLVSYSGNF